MTYRANMSCLSKQEIDKHAVVINKTDLCAKAMLAEEVKGKKNQLK